MVRLIVYSLLLLVLTALVLGPAIVSGQLNPATALLTVLIVGVGLGLVLTTLSFDMEICVALAKRAKSLPAAIAFSAAAGFCMALALAVLLAVINIAYLAGLETVLSRCAFGRQLLLFGPWHLALGAAMILFLPALVLVRAIARAAFARWAARSAI